MNLNEQLQQAYEAGRRQGLNEMAGGGSPPAGQSTPTAGKGYDLPPVWQIPMIRPYQSWPEGMPPEYRPYRPSLPGMPPGPPPGRPWWNPHEFYRRYIRPFSPIR